MAPRTSGSNLGRSFVQAEENISEAEKEIMAYNEKRVEEEEEDEEGKDALRHTLEAMSLNKSQVNVSSRDIFITENDAILRFLIAGKFGQLQAAIRVDCEKSKEFSGEE